MPALVRRRLLLEHADRLDAHGARRREDPHPGGDRPAGGVGVSRARTCSCGSARLARYGHDFTHVERLGRAALRRWHDARGRVAGR